MRIRDDLDPLRQRATVILVTILVVFGALHLRLFHLQILTGASWRMQAENNRLRRFPLGSPRGRIFDRRGTLLADNLPAWNLLVFPEETARLEETALFLARCGIGQAHEILELVRRSPAGRAAPQVVAKGLSWEQVTRIRAHQREYPELSVISGLKRVYPFGETTAHAIGYLRLVSSEVLAQNPSMDPNSLVGANGVEAMMNDTLAGTDGERWVVVSAIGRQLGVLREESASMGQDVAVTLDLEVQRAAAVALGDESGAVVALDPRNGAVRAMYSSPSFDPNIFVGRLSPESWRELAEDPNHPLQNRALQGTYPPGSTIKPFFAIGALIDGVCAPGWQVYCTGSVTLYNHPFRCWRRGGHGRVGLQHSLEASCDTFYYLLGQKMGIDRMAKWLARWGYGSSTSLGFPTEAAGLIGTPEWSREVRGTPWYPGEAVSVSIGQGPLLVTAIQLARAYSSLANGGTLVSPHIVESASMPPAVDLGLDPDFLEQVTRGLDLVTHGAQGTARVLGSLPVAGKTGTAQVARLVEGVDSDDRARHLRHHAWFVGWAPVKEPRIVVVMLVEHGGSGGAVAAPLAKGVFEAALAR